ncbi:MAG TPA: tetratricopeptide repeat protein [Burkholderiaceae bacterium]
MRPELKVQVMIGARNPLTLVLALAVSLSAAAAPPMTRSQALQAIEQRDPEQRLAGIARLAEIGTMADADRLVPRLSDDNGWVREVASAAMWQIWSRSGERAIDLLFNRGVEQMQAGEFDAALATFSEIVRRKPAFAEGWNKRATVLFLMGENERSLRDCDEVLVRNPNHFGALSGAGQIHLKLGNTERALEYFERALKINPGLTGTAEVIERLEQRLQDKRRRTI